MTRQDSSGAERRPAGPPEPDRPGEIKAPALSDLLAQMAKGSSTNGWDVVSSYSVDALDKVLAASYQAGSLVDEVKFSVQRLDPLTLGKFTIDYDVKLGAPGLQFVGGQSGYALVRMPILGGTYTVTPDGGKPAQRTLPSGYSVVANVPLAAITGDGTITTAGNVITFAHPDDAVHVVLHFKKTIDGVGPTFTIQPEPTPDSQDVLAYFLSQIQLYFANQVNELDYALTGVTPKVKAGEVVIVPKSFVFASDTGVLSLYLLTTNSGGSGGNIHPAFQPGGIEILPIPKGYTASIILSQALVKQIYLQPALSRLGRVEYDESVPGGIGIRWYRRTPALNFNPSHLGTSQLSIDTLSVDFDQLPYKLRFFNNDVSVSWEFSQRLSWRTDVIDLATHDDTSEDGQTTVHATLSETVPLTAPSGDDISLDLTITPDRYQISAEGRTGWFSSGENIATSLTSYLRSQSIGVSFELGGLNYFTAANLLFPRSHTFRVAATAGLNIPHDLLLLGQIA